MLSACLLLVCLQGCGKLQGTECRSDGDCTQSDSCELGWCKSKLTTEPPSPPKKQEPTQLLSCPTADAKVMENLKPIKRASQSLEETTAIGQTAINGHFLYWTDHKNGHVMRRSLQSNESEVLYNNVGIVEKWLFDDKYIYVAINTTLSGGKKQSKLLKLLKEPQGQKNLQVLAENIAPIGAMTQSKTHLYWVTIGSIEQTLGDRIDGALFRLAKSGKDEKITLLVEQKRPYAIAIDATHLYWITSHRSGALKRIKLSGGAVETLLKDLPFAGYVATKGDYVYYTTNNLWRINKDLSLPAEQMTAQVKLERAFAFDSLFVYVATTMGFLQIPLRCSHAGTVFSTATPGHVESIMVSPEHVYLLTRIDRTSPAQFFQVHKRQPQQWYRSED